VTGQHPPRTNLSTVLAERFARGKIDQQEFHQPLDALGGTPGPALSIESTRTAGGSAARPAWVKRLFRRCTRMTRVASAMSRQDGSFGEEQPFGQLDHD
jgi:hypothetical protein